MGGYADVDMAKEILAPGYDWRLETSAEGIKNLPILIVNAKYDTPDDQGTELVAALRHLHAADVTTITMDTDHPFSDHRIALQKEILSWLQQRTSRPATNANSR
jgi:alpha/beta superfamily hydrolase